LPCHSTLLRFPWPLALRRPGPVASGARPAWRAWPSWPALRLACAWLLAALLLAPPLRAETPEISSFDIVHNEEGVSLSFAVRFELPRGVEDALQKGVPLFFVAEADIFRDRWYWLDRRVTSTSRTWRLAYQPLTRKYRVTFGGLNQTFETLVDAMAGVRRISAWKLAEPGQLDDGARHYVEFRYRLDTTQLPRPMQIGIGGQTDWTVQVEKFQRFN